MKRLFLLLAVIVADSFCVSAQNGWEDISFQPSKNTAYRKVRLRKAELPDVLAVKDGIVWLSEKPNGEAEGYYGVQTANGFLYNGSKEKVKTSAMKPVGDGWYEFDFGKDLYILDLKQYAHLENVKFLPSGVTSSSSSTTSQASGNNQVSNASIPPLKMLTPHSPAEEGWTLAETSKVTDKITLEHYVKEVEDDEIHMYSYKKENGDIINRKTKANRDDESSILNSVDGDFKWTFEDGRQQIGKGGIIQTKYPNGVVEQKINGEEEKGHYLYLPDNPNKGYGYTDPRPLHAKDIYFVFDSDIRKGFLIEDRLYEIDKMGNLNHMYQKIQGKYFPACSTDTITEIKEYTSKDETGDNNIFEAHYKNGDYYKVVKTARSWYQAGTLHRGKGTIRILKNGEISYRMNDGSTFVFAFSQYDDDIAYTIKQILQKEDPALYTGWLTDANGNKEFYEYGKSESQKKKDAEEAKVKEKAELAKVREPYIKKYGYYPGDYDSVRDMIKPGRKFGAIEEFTSVSLEYNNGTSKKYKVWYRSYSGEQYVYVWVKNGIITSVVF